MTYTYLDLFAGCGGLSLGLESSGGDLILAVERSPMAAETFYHNLILGHKTSDSWVQHLAKSTEQQASSGLIVKDVASLLNSSELVSKLADTAPDVVVGGPPCQGFSLAGRRDPEDVRNSLPWQFLEVVAKTSPKMVVIENVLGMKHNFKAGDNSAYQQLAQALRTTGRGYLVQQMEVNALHYGAPQNRPRLLLVGLRVDLAESQGVTATTTIWRSNFLDKLEGETPPLSPKPTLTSANKRLVGDALVDLIETSQSDAGTIEEYSSSWGLNVDPIVLELQNHEVRKHNEKTIQRFRLYQVLSEAGIDSRILSKYTRSNAEQRASLWQSLQGKFTYPALSPDGVVIASGDSEMLDLLESLGTNKHSQTVLTLQAPARTVVTIGDDYVHPVYPRTFTVRELARFQGFPDWYVFKSKITTGGTNRKSEVPQYSQVGNAVSPFLARAIGLMIESILGS